VHDHALLLRNKNIGHRVNDWTQVVASAVLEPDTGGRGVRQVSSTLVMAMGGGESADELREVAVLLYGALGERLIAIEADLMSQLKLLPLDELYEKAARGEPIAGLSRPT
jgi:hypothetical protein